MGLRVGIVDCDLWHSLFAALPVLLFKRPARTVIYTLSLHDALPIWRCAPLESAACAPPPSRPFPASASRGCCQRSVTDRKSTRLNSSHVAISYAVFCLKKKKECEPVLEVF